MKIKCNSQIWLALYKSTVRYNIKNTNSFSSFSKPVGLGWDELGLGICLENLNDCDISGKSGRAQSKLCWVPSDGCRTLWVFPLC